MIHRFFEQRSAMHPDAVALRYEGASTSYGALNAAANRIAHKLLALGVQPEDFVALIADHSPRMVAAILGAIKSGAAYVAMEPDFPPERIAFVLAETGARFALTQRDYAGLLPEGVEPIFIEDVFESFSAENPAVKGISSSSALYALYTSGTTGTPKGVVVEHGNVANYVEAFDAQFALTPRDRMVQCSVCTFDIFVEELYPILLRGGTLLIATKEERGDAAVLGAMMRRERATIVSGFPYLLRDLQRHRLPDSLRVAISGGDVLRGEYIDKLAEKIPVYNTYGPSETTVCATYYRYAGEQGAVPIGRAIKGVSVKILDTGEICIAGAGVARGYLSRPEETACAFTSEGYLTGDLGRLLPDGNIEFLGRKDRQVMIWGKRVEPDEVEAVMMRAAGVELAAVKSAGENRLAAYWVGADVDWRNYLSRYLTDYMIPATFTRLDEMPRTLSGKIDYGALCAPVEFRRATRDDLELLVELREEVLASVYGVQANLGEASRDYYLRDDHTIWLALDGGQVVGCGAICFYRTMPSPDSPNGRCATIVNMYTRPSHRRRGIASQIMERLIREARERGVTRLMLETTALGKGVYERFEFTQQPRCEAMELKLK